MTKHVSVKYLKNCNIIVSFTAYWNLLQLVKTYLESKGNQKCKKQEDKGRENERDEGRDKGKDSAGEGARERTKEATPNLRDRETT